MRSVTSNVASGRKSVFVLHRLHRVNPVAVILAIAILSASPAYCAYRKLQTIRRRRVSALFLMVLFPDMGAKASRNRPQRAVVPAMEESSMPVSQAARRS